MKTLIIKTNLSFMGGWGNGYVIIPKEHPLHGVHYDDIDVDVHGGLTYSEYLNDETIECFKLDYKYKGGWMVGFDTCHYGDTPNFWTKERVKKETDRLKEQLINYK